LYQKFTNWQTQTDQSIGGTSSASWENTLEGNGKFTGILNTNLPEQSKLKKIGFCGAFGPVSEPSLLKYHPLSSGNPEVFMEFREMGSLFFENKNGTDLFFSNNVR
jgi:hypothetical protein